MPGKPRKSGNKAKIKDLPAKKPSSKEEASTKGGIASGRNFFGGIGETPSATLPKLTEDTAGNMQVDGT